MYPITSKKRIAVTIRQKVAQCERAPTVKMPTISHSFENNYFSDFGTLIFWKYLFFDIFRPGAYYGRPDNFWVKSLSSNFLSGSNSGLNYKI